MNVKRWEMKQTLTTGSCMLAALLVMGATVAQASDPFEIVPHEMDVYGARYIDSGEYEKAVERLKTRLGGPRQAHSLRAPVLIDLCVGYTMLKQFDEADQYCSEAVDVGWYRGLALNNRGVMKIAQGNYEAAIADFQAATEASGAKAVSQRNLDRAQQSLAARRAESDNRYAALDATIGMVSPTKANDQ